MHDWPAADVALLRPRHSGFGTVLYTITESVTESVSRHLRKEPPAELQQHASTPYRLYYRCTIAAGVALLSPRHSDYGTVLLMHDFRVRTPITESDPITDPVARHFVEGTAGATIISTIISRRY